MRSGSCIFFKFSIVELTIHGSHFFGLGPYFEKFLASKTKNASHEILIRLWRIQKKYSFLSAYSHLEVFEPSLLIIKITFDFKAPIYRPRRVILGKLVLLRYSLALTSIFIIKVDFPPNTDILNYGNDKAIWYRDFLQKYHLKIDFENFYMKF
jgi:hypothetical protein